jgi:hypothetical protein
MSTEAQAAARRARAGLSPLDPPGSGGGTEALRGGSSMVHAWSAHCATVTVVCSRVDRLRVSHAMLAQHSLPRTTH